MAGIKISALPPVVTPTLTDVFPIDQGSTTFKIEIGQLADFYLPLSGGTMSGAINMGGNFITGLTLVGGVNLHTVISLNDSLGSVNYFDMHSSDTGSPILLDATGSDANVTMNLRTKNGDFWFSDFTGTAAPAIMLFDDIGTNSVGFKSPATLSGNSVYILPPTYPDVDGYVLSSLMDGTTSWAANGSGGGVTVAQVQTGDMNFVLDTGVADAIVVTLDPAITVLTNDLIIRVQVSSDNLTPSPTINPNGLGATGIALLGNNTVAVNDMVQNGIAVLIYNENLSNFILQNPATSLAATANVTNGLYTTVADTGTANNYVASSSFYPSLGPQNGQEVTFNPTHSNTGASNFNYNGQGNVAIHLIDGTDLLPDDIFLNTNAKLFYNAPTATWILTNPVVSGGGVTSTQVQQSAFNSGSDVTNTNGYVIALTPPITALTDGLTVFAAITNTNTGNVTLDVGTGPNAVESLQQILLNGGEIPGGGISSIFTWNASAGLWVLQNNAALSATSIQYQKYTYSVDSGAANAYVGTYNPSLASLGAQDGLKVGLYIAFSGTNTGPSTFDAGFGPQTVAMNDGVFSPTPPGAIANSGYYEFEWAASLGFWLLLNPSIQSTSTIFGTQTNDDAFAGYMGEFIESVIASGSAVSIPSSNTPVDITSVSLGAGDWDLYGNFGSNISGGTTTKLTAWISATSATQPDASQSASVALSAILTGEGFCVPYQRISLASPATIYLSASAAFTLSTVSGYGKISARRPR